jgi:hypothetical protein
MNVPKTAVKKLWAYISARESLRLQKAAGAPYPWSPDPILTRFKFTNVKREHDRTTIHFMNIYARHTKTPPATALFNCTMYRYFGTMAFANEVGWLDGYDRKAITGAARRLKARGVKVFTGAYIVTNAGLSQPKEVTVADYLKGMWKQAMTIVEAIEGTRTWEAGFAAMTAVKGFGGAGFMAKEALSDYLLWRRLAGWAPLVDEATFSPVGPGARRGLNRLFGRDKNARQPIPEFQAEQLALRAAVQPSWARLFPSADPLTAHDIQFCLCEVDKWMRVKNGEGRPRSLYRPPE